MEYKNVFQVGTEFKEIKFDGFWDWFINISDLKVHWANQPSYVVSQFLYLFGGLATLFHAFIRGGRLPYLWLATFIHGCVVESLSYMLPDVDNFWQSQTNIIFLGRRFPLHIMLLYPCFIYSASIAAAKLRLPKWSEPFTVGLLVVLIDIPYDIVSVRFMHWSWHDTDPSIYDRHYWVPWNSYYFHLTFAAGFTFWFHFLRRKLCNSEGKWIADRRIWRELLCTLLTGLLGVPGGIAMFLPIYHPLHDSLKIHSEVTFFMIFGICLVISWVGDRIPKEHQFSKGNKPKVHWTTWLSILHLILHYATFLAIPILFNPEDETSTGLRETIGPCSEYMEVQTVYSTLQRRKYLCPTDYDEGYFNWNCLPGKKSPSNGSKWYTICGVPFENRAEYISIVSVIILIASVIFYNIHFKSGGDDVFRCKDTVKTKGIIQERTKKSKRN